MRHATYIRNCAYTKAVPDKTPYEKWLGNHPDVSFIQQFGCPVWILNQELNPSKLDPKAQKFTFVGYEEGPNTVKVSREYWWPMKVSPPVTEQRFEGEDETRVKPPSDAQVQTGNKRKLTDEAEMSAGKHRKGGKTDLHVPGIEKTSSPRQQDDQMKCSSINNNKTSQKDEMMNLPSSDTPDLTVEEVQDEDDIPGLYHDDDDVDDKNDEADCAELVSTAAAAVYTAFTAIHISGNDPKSLEEAKNSPEWPEWEKAIQTELETLRRMGTWESISK
ncbi:hypothetical protein OG21DRAFT_1521383 [Imleria badia]|nr:hypothetical protein OG21DRAFT_1521383 [Imleria badia]